jgi:hypothetical protein
MLHACSPEPHTAVTANSSDLGIVAPSRGDSTVSSVVPEVPVTGAVAEKQQRVKRALESLTFRETRSVFHKIEERFREEVAACRDEACRTMRLAEQLDRVAYSEGWNREMGDLPWRSGHFSSAEGNILILPLGDGKIAATISASGDDGDWICFLEATGRVDGKGEAVMTVHEPDTDRPAQFLLRSLGRDRIALRRLGFVEEGSEQVLSGEDDDEFEYPLRGYCGMNGSFLGDYSVAKPIRPIL